MGIGLTKATAVAVDRPLRETVDAQRLYSKVASEYDRFFVRAILAEEVIESRILRWLPPGPLLDLACGSGRWKPKVGDRQYTGLDLNGDMLAIARQRYGDIHLVQANMTELPLASESYEAVICMFGAIGHLPADDQRHVFREVHRVLRPGGLFIVATGNVWSPFSLPVTLLRGWIAVKGMYLRIHSLSPRELRDYLAEDFEILEFESYDFSFLPIDPLQILAECLGRDYRTWYRGAMTLFQSTTQLPGFRWIGKQMYAIARKTG